mgnify:FL=1
MNDVECIQCEWKGTVDECHWNEDDVMVCPECGSPVEIL